MKRTLKLLSIVAFIALVVPLVFMTGNANSAVYNPDGATHNGTTGGWTLPSLSGTPDIVPAAPNGNNCLACHQTGGTTGKDASGYLTGGHKNMSRPTVDGKKWTMPGVTATAPYLGDSVAASVGADGSFLSLWIKEDYPKMPVTWTATPATIAQGYCGRGATAFTPGTNSSSADLPNLTVCPTCETPIFGDGNPGYPLGYPTQTICEAAGYQWNASTPSIYWIYGGAGLEGGPPMYEPGAQNYKCGRCHTTGWTADGAANTGKHPFSDGTPTAATIVGGAALVTSTSTTPAFNYSSWDQWGIECSRCHTSAKDGSHANSVATDFPKGGDVVAACMTCHRMESDANPRPVVGGNGFAANSSAAMPYTNKQQQPDGFAHHPDGPEFLNSPHARFTGTFGQIGCPPYAINGYNSYVSGTQTQNYSNPSAPTDCTPGQMTLAAESSLYASKFAKAAKLLGDSNSTAGTCVTCHDVHKPLNENVAGMSTSVQTECIACHANAANTVTPQVNLAVISHPGGLGTPLENVATDPTQSCEICHQPAGIKHLWRINTSASYATYGNYTHVDDPTVAGAGQAVNLSNTAADGTYANAVWIDLDNACGQCHGGGVASTDAVTTGSITATAGNMTTLTVANAAGFAAGKEITIAGAGVAGGPHKTIIAQVSGNTVYLTYKASTTVSGAAVTVSGNPPATSVPYFTKTQLAAAADGIHGGTLSLSGCVACHTETMPNHMAGTGTPSTCLSCHTGTLHAASTPTPTLANSCSICHGARTPSGGATAHAATALQFRYAPTAVFSSVVTGLKVSVNAGGSTCPSGQTPCTYGWTFGDTGTGTGVTTSHTYAGAGTYPVVLTVTSSVGTTATATHNAVIAGALNTAPTVGKGAVVTTGLTVAFKDTSTDDNLGGAGTVYVNWGDGSALSTGAMGSTFTKTYASANTYSIDHYVKDAGGLYSSHDTFQATVPTKYKVTVTASGSLAGALVQIKTIPVPPAAAVTKAQGNTSTSGVYTSLGLDPGNYTMTISKYGYVFDCLPIAGNQNTNLPADLTTGDKAFTCTHTP